AEGDRQAARSGASRLRHRRLSRRSSRFAYLVRCNGRHRQHRNPGPVARLGVGANGMSNVRVLIADAMDPRAAAIFRERGITVDEKPGLSPDELKAIIGDYDGLAVRSSTKVNAAAMDAALPRLKVIGRAGIGVDTIDVPAASARGIVVMNTPFGNSITTAEHAIAMLFALAREIPQANQSTQSGKWEKNRFM